MTVPQNTEQGDDAELTTFCRRFGLQHEHTRESLIREWDFHPFGQGRFRRARNVVHGTVQGRAITAFEYHYVLTNDSVEANGYERDSLRRYLVCVAELGHSVPSLAAVRRDWFEWHDEALPGLLIEIDHEYWSRRFVLVGSDIEFGRSVVTPENASRCAEADIFAEWRFNDDQLLLWVHNGRVTRHLLALLAVARPLISAAESFRPPAALT